MPLPHGLLPLYMTTDNFCEKLGSPLQKIFFYFTTRIFALAGGGTGKKFSALNPFHYPTDKWSRFVSHLSRKRAKNVLLEGAATGRALITSDIPGCREAVEDGVSGYLCPAQDAEGLTQAMRDFAQQSFDRQVQMGQNGRALVERKFDKQLVVAQTLGGLDLPAAVRS